VKAQQDIAHLTRVKTNSEKDGYKKRGHKIYGPDFEMNAHCAPEAVEMPR
jgi:hypothetical protein